ncbi:MAG: 50S ribosomal protein L15 [Bacteroidia bacterium]|nr:50S ribosomal protein L15 [Bacteroidia bacterium]
MSHILHQLRPAPGTVHRKKRVGRGEGSGHGGTSTRGHKGDRSRSGYRTKRGFEGGQMPYQRRIPKFGFRNPFRVLYFPLNLGRIEELLHHHPEVQELTPEWLYEKGIVRKGFPIKVLGKDVLSRPIVIQAHRFSAAAQKAIEAAGGKAISLHP